MQKLKGRKTYTPTDISQVRGNCDSVIKQSCEAGTVLQNNKTSFNNPDATLTAREQAGQNLRVSVIYVLNKKGKPLMPCSPRKAKILLKGGKAKVIKRTPFVIQLCQATGETKQKVSLGIDPGYKYVGLSAITEKKELFRAEAQLRVNIVQLLSKRKQYRSQRRLRKLRYRKRRGLNPGIKKGYLSPSIRHKIESTIKLVKITSKFLPITNIIVEEAHFDIEKIKNPDILSIQYAEGPMKGFYNVREYVLFRDSHLCQYCKGKSKNKKLNVHHIVSRQVGSNAPNNLITLCKTCHDLYHIGAIKLNYFFPRRFKEETYMNIAQKRIVQLLKLLGPSVNTTFGYIVKEKRKQNGIEKSHSNDAFIIAGGTNQKRSDILIIKQQRKCNRKLFRGDRSHIRNTAARYIHGYSLFDKVLYKNKEYFIFGRRKDKYFYIGLLDSTEKYSDLHIRNFSLLERGSTLLFQRKTKHE